MTLDEMPVEIESISGGGLDIRGVIEQYRVNAGKSVNAGDFVEFVHKFGAGEFAGGMAELAACKLDNNRILMAYQDTGNSYYGTAVVLTIKEGAISMGEKVIFQNDRTQEIHLTSLSHNKVFVSYIRRPYSSYPVVNIFTIDEDKITISPNKVQIIPKDSSSSGVESTYGLTHSVLSNQRVLVSFTSSPASSSNNYIRYYLLSVNDTSIETITSNSISMGITSGNYLVKLTEALVLNVYLYGGIKARIISIGESHLTCGNVYAIGSCGGYDSAVIVEKLSNESAVVLYGDENNSMYGTARVIKISGTQLTLETPTVFKYGGGYYLQSVQLSENKILVMSYGIFSILDLFLKGLK
jgi:hypothetical protein